MNVVKKEKKKVDDISRQHDFRLAITHKIGKPHTNNVNYDSMNE